MTTAHYDAIVIGAGFAGMTAARELGSRGKRTLVLEAKDRVGGRAYTETLAGHLVELGGAWVHWTQPHVWTEITRYGLGIVPDEKAVFANFPGADGQMKTYPGAEILARQQELLERLFAGWEEYFERPHDPWFRAEKLAEVDKLSLRDRILELELSPEDENLLWGWASGESGGLSSRGALTMPGHWWAMGGLQLIGFDAIFNLRLEVGMQKLVELMAADVAESELRLNTAVKAVHDDGTAVIVTAASGEVFTASTAVVTVPVNVWKNIEFSPALPEPYTRASTETIGVPNAVKLALHLRGDFEGAFYAQGEEGSAFIGLFPHRVLPDGTHLVVGFCVEEGVDVNDRKQVEDAVRHLEPRAEVIDYKLHDWGRDEFSEGGWAYRQPGQLTTMQEIQRPQGRLAFASGDIANGWSGCVDGAIESGIVAARHVAGLLGQD
ncbi:NAD(P)/FAD-dependent oxidoreductase [Saccharothrix longispora]|uniref:flavin monoamine oxidase family protein n=1 Tax=Saccharothrix longispora TaxID=33920 RepID=UPI0028FD7396|nr:NAD(P)/FAD-dependent oxidoreductase [Saccharothrix longispora]MDU0287702.1 NAD(P)/FAD-dependent oxidoreductase [Saccharothrix longispora]